MSDWRTNSVIIVTAARAPTSTNADSGVRDLVGWILVAGIGIYGELFLDCEGRWRSSLDRVTPNGTNGGAWTTSRFRTYRGGSVAGNLLAARHR